MRTRTHMRACAAFCAILFLCQGFALAAHSHGLESAADAHSCLLCQLILVKVPVDLVQPLQQDDLRIAEPIVVRVAEPIVRPRAVDLRTRGPPLHLL